MLDKIEKKIDSFHEFLEAFMAILIVIMFLNIFIQLITK